MTETLKQDMGTFLFNKLLNNRIMINSTPVPVNTEYTPTDEFATNADLTEINLNGGGGEGKIGSFIFNQTITLTSDNPYYDPTNPGRQYAAQKVRWSVYKESIEVHIWSHYNRYRDHVVTSIVDDIMENVLMGNYQYCDKYNPTTQLCSTTSKKCDAIIIKNVYGTEGLCPYLDITDSSDPDYRNPSNYFVISGIRDESVKLRTKAKVDQLNFTPPIYHSNLTFDYIRDTYLILNTVPFTTFNVDVTLD